MDRSETTHLDSRIRSDPDVRQAPEPRGGLLGAAIATHGGQASRTSVAEQLAAEDKIAGNDVIVEQAGYVNELPRQALWWGPFTTAVSTAILEAAQAGTPADQVIDDLATQWNDLKAEYE